MNNKFYLLDDDNMSESNNTVKKVKPIVATTNTSERKEYKKAPTFEKKHNNDLKYSKPCKFITNNERCPRGDICIFAHFLDQMTKPPTCNFGDNCRKLHNRTSVCLYSHPSDSSWSIYRNRTGVPVPNLPSKNTTLSTEECVETKVNEVTECKTENVKNWCSIIKNSVTNSPKTENLNTESKTTSEHQKITQDSIHVEEEVVIEIPIDIVEMTVESLIKDYKSKNMKVPTIRINII